MMVAVVDVAAAAFVLAVVDDDMEHFMHGSAHGQATIP